MDEEIEQINVEPEFQINPFEDCDDDYEYQNVEKIDTPYDPPCQNWFPKSLNKTPTDSKGKKDGRKKCIYCDKVYKTKYMATHLRTHSGEKPYKCDFQAESGLDCGKSFMRLEHLQRHSRVHDGIKLYKCEVCAKDFSRSDHLKKHMLIHLGIKPFCCQVCLKTFGRPDHLRKHIQTHLKDTTYFSLQSTKTTIKEHYDDEPVISNEPAIELDQRIRPKKISSK